LVWLNAMRIVHHQYGCDDYKISRARIVSNLPNFDDRRGSSLCVVLA
jgi:hypothetical protein